MSLGGSSSYEKIKPKTASSPISPTTSPHQKRGVHEARGPPAPAALTRNISEPLTTMSGKAGATSHIKDRTHVKSALDDSALDRRATPKPSSTPSSSSSSLATTKASSHFKLKQPRVRLRALVRAVRALVSLNQWASKRQNDSPEAQENFKALMTGSGRYRLRDLPLSPLTNLAEQCARDEVCMVCTGVFQSNWRGGERAEELKEMGITHVFSTLEASENPHPDKFVYKNMVFEDADDEALDDMWEEAVAFIGEGVRAGGCLVHCAAGVSRSSTMMLAFLMHHHRWTLLESFFALRERRPVVWPNPGFMAQLIKLEQKLYGALGSLSKEQYDQWASTNTDAIQMARQVDRVKI